MYVCVCASVYPVHIFPSRLLSFVLLELTIGTRWYKRGAETLTNVANYIASQYNRSVRLENIAAIPLSIPCSYRFYRTSKHWLANDLQKIG